MTRDLYKQHQRRQRNSGQERQRHRGTEKVQKIFRPCVFEPLRLIIKKSAKRASERNYRNSSRRFKAGNDTDEVAQQDKQAERHQEGSKAFTVMTDNFLALGLNESVGAFEDVLQCARLVD